MVEIVQAHDAGKAVESATPSRRQAGATGGRATGETAAGAADRTGPTTAGPDAEALHVMWDVMGRAWREQTRQNLDFMIDLSGTRGFDQLLAGQQRYWTETLDRAQRLNRELVELARRSADRRPSARV